MEVEEAITKVREAHEAIQMKELEEITTLLEQLALVSKESETGPTMNAHDFINYELKFYLNNPYTPTEEEIIGMLDEGGDAADNVQISDVIVDRVGLKNPKSALVTLKQKLDYKPSNVTPFVPEHSNTSKRNKILACTRISSNHHRFVLPVCLDV